MSTRETREEFRAIGGFVFIPPHVGRELVEARAALEEASDTNAGDAQRAHLRWQKAMKAACTPILEAFEP